MVLGVLSAAAVFAGLAVSSMVLVYGTALSAFAYLALLVIGGYLLALGAAYVVAAKPETA